MGFPSGFQCSFRAFFRGHVAFNKNTANLGGHLFTALFVQVQDGHFVTGSRQGTRCAFTQAGCTAGDDGGSVFEIHNLCPVIGISAAENWPRIVYVYVNLTRIP